MNQKEFEKIQSSLPSTPQEKFDLIVYLYENGWVDTETVLQMLNFPDNKNRIK